MATTASDDKPTDSTTDTIANKPEETEVVTVASPDEAAPDNVQEKDATSNDVEPDQVEAKEEVKAEEQGDEKKEPDDLFSKIDFDSIDKLLYAEPIGSNTNDLSYDNIQFESDEEKQGAMDLAKHLRTANKLVNLPPFEMARFYIGSKQRIEKATKKWMDTMVTFKQYKLETITEQRMIKCFREMSRSMRFGGVDDQGRAILAIKYSLWFPANYEGTDVIMRCFINMLNIFTEQLDYARNGVLFIADCKDMGWCNFNLEMEKIFSQLLQEGYPMRVAGMYMLDAPLLLNIMMKICKPFLSKKMQERMKALTTEELFQIIPKEQVPTMINGG
eukprot:252309_1